MDIPEEPTHIVTYYCALLHKVFSKPAYFSDGLWHTFDINRTIATEFGDIVNGVCELFTVAKNRGHLCDEFPYAAQLSSGEQRGDFKTYEDCKNFCDWMNHVNETGDNCRLEQYIQYRSPTTE